MNTLDLVNYYADLLSLPYTGKARAYATIQASVTGVIMPQTSTQILTFSDTPISGSFTLVYDENSTAAINWNDDTATIQTKLRSVPGLSMALVSGAIPSLTVTFNGVMPPALLLSIGTNTLGVSITITETDLTIPLAVQNAFNLLGDNPAVGVQLDVLGKYAGVSRTSQGFTAQITLSDADFLSLIRVAILENSSGSSTKDIVELLNQFFPGQIFLFDLQTMEFDYYISESIGSTDLLQVFIEEGKLPKPMGVRIRAIIYAPVINMFFGLGSYESIPFNVTPFNDYIDYHTDWPWLSYTDAIVI